MKLRALLLCLIALLLPGLAMGQGVGTPGPPQIILSLPQTTFIGPDGSPQFGILPNPAATEYWSALGGLTGAGGNFFTTNGTLSGNVDGNFAAQNLGQFWWGNGSGTLAAILDPGGPAGAYIGLKPSNSISTTAPNTAAIVSTGDLSLSMAASGRLSTCIPDGTTACGNARGSGSIDFQGLNARGNANQVAGAANTFILGGSNNRTGGSGYCTVLPGFGNICDGPTSQAAGINSHVNGRMGVRVYANALFATQGDTQSIDATLSGASTTSAGVRLTADHNAAAASTTNNCFNLPVKKSAALQVVINGQDGSNAAKTIGYFNTLLIQVEGALATGQVFSGTATTLGTDTVTVTYSYDATNFCLNLTVAPTSLTTDSWFYTARLTGAETLH